MATSPAFASTAALGSQTISSSADNTWTAPANTVTIVTAGASGTKIEEIVVQGIGVTIAGMLNIYIHDGTNYHLFDQVSISAVTATTTATAYRAVRQYTNLVLKSGWSLRASSMVASQLAKVSAFGGDL